MFVNIVKYRLVYVSFDNVILFYKEMCDFSNNQKNMFSFTVKQ
jgi:hypothetical protein